MHLYENQGFDKANQPYYEDLEPTQSDYDCIDDPTDPSYMKLTEGDGDIRKVSCDPSNANILPEGGGPTKPTMASTSTTMSVRCCFIFVIIGIFIGAAVATGITYFIVRKGESSSSIYINRVFCTLTSRKQFITSFSYADSHTTVLDSLMLRRDVH